MTTYSAGTPSEAMHQKGMVTIGGGNEQWYNKPCCIFIHATDKPEPLLVGRRFIVPECSVDESACCYC